MMDSNLPTIMRRMSSISEAAMSPFELTEDCSTTRSRAEDGVISKISLGRNCEKAAIAKNQRMKVDRRLSPPGSVVLPVETMESLTRVHTLLPGMLSFCGQRSDSTSYPHSYNFISSKIAQQYTAFNQDFGPVSLDVLGQFCEKMHRRLQNNSDNRIQVVCCGACTKERSNAYFLLAAYLVVMHDWTPEQACHPFDKARVTTVPFRDASPRPADFFLSLKDCVSGLWKAKSKGWLSTSSSHWPPSRAVGDIDRICPKFVAFKGPVADERLLRSSSTDFSPEIYAEVLQKMGVTAVVQLNPEGRYPTSAFKRRGIRHYFLPFPDCHAPTVDQVREFLEICNKEAGLVAVHCQAGLGRTGTMIAAWIIKNHGFTAREAIAWLRLVRPGCVIGPQQHFLSDMSLALAAAKKTASFSSAADLSTEKGTSSPSTISSSSSSIPAKQDDAHILSSSTRTSTATNPSSALGQLNLSSASLSSADSTSNLKPPGPGKEDASDSDHPARLCPLPKHLRVRVSSSTPSSADPSPRPADGSPDTPKSGARTPVRAPSVAGEEAARESVTLATLTRSNSQNALLEGLLALQAAKYGARTRGSSTDASV